MNERTKRILSYVACTLGGFALGVTLLGGLSYCSVSEKAEQTEVNTILTKKNASGTTADGVPSYHFDITTDWTTYGTRGAMAYWYSLGSNYDPTLLHSEGNSATQYTDLTEWNDKVDYLDYCYNKYSPSATETYFLAVFGYNEIYQGAPEPSYWYYGTLIYSRNTWGTSAYKLPTSFIQTNLETNLGYLLRYFTAEYGLRKAYSSSENPILLGTTKSEILQIATGATRPNYIRYVDVQSYYHSRGYESGYEDGENVGYWAGYNEGVGTAGNFTNISGNVNALIDLSELGVSTTTSWYSHGLSDSKYYTLLQFRDQDEESWTVYIEDGVASDQPDGTRTAYINLYSHSQQVYKGWLGYAVRNSSTNTFSVQKINEYSFEFATVTNVLGRSLTQEYVLIWGWVSDNVSYQAGYNAGYADGFEGTNVNNVFSLFTGAFNAVGGIFNLKVFGFLPLYWFFLTPIFIAIIALLLRMIKH